MNTASTSPSSAMAFTTTLPSLLDRAIGWLDARSKGTLIVMTVAGFVFVPPAGLALLAYLIWSKRMFSKSCGHSRRHAHHAARHMGMSSGNAAFDAYKTDTLRRLEEEQTNFEAFLARLREAKDKAEFDQFMDDRASDAPKAKDDAENEPA